MAHYFPASVIVVSEVPGSRKRIWREVSSAAALDLTVDVLRAAGPGVLWGIVRDGRAADKVAFGWRTVEEARAVLTREIPALRVPPKRGPAPRPRPRFRGDLREQTA